MSTINKVADLTVKNFSELPENQNKVIDPALVGLVVELINQLVAMFQQCKANKASANKMVKNPTLFQRVALRRVVRNTLDDRQAFREHGEGLIAALRKTGNEVSEDDLGDLLENS